MKRRAERSGSLILTTAHAMMWALLWIPPFLVLPTLKDAFRLPKLLASELIALVALLLISWRLRELESLSWRQIWRLPALRLALPILVAASFGILTSEHPFHVRSALADLAIGLTCLVVWSQALATEHLRRLVRGLLGPATVLALLAIGQYHALYRPFSFAGEAEARRVGVTSLAGSVGELAAYLVLPCLIAQLGLWSTRGRRRWLWASVLAVNLYALVVSQTLAAIAALTLASTVLWWTLLPRRKAVAATLAAILMVLVLVVSVSPVRHRVRAVGNQVQRGQLNVALTGRLDGWRTALWMLRENPWVGVGHGAYRAEFSTAKLALLAEGVEFYRGHVYATFVNAHNELLEAAAEWGFAGVLALAWGLWILGYQVRRRGAGAPAAALEDRALMTAGLVALGILSLVYFPLRVALLAYPAVLLLSWAMSGAPEAVR